MEPVSHQVPTIRTSSGNKSWKLAHFNLRHLKSGAPFATFIYKKKRLGYKVLRSEAAPEKVLVIIEININDKKDCLFQRRLDAHEEKWKHLWEMHLTGQRLK